MADSIEQLSFELTASALAEQERALSGLRTRAGTVLAAASIAGSFLAVNAGHGSLHAWGVLAMISFVSCVGSAVWILLPHELVFAFYGQALLADDDQRGLHDMTEAYRAVGVWLEQHLEANGDEIAGLSGWLAASCALLAIEVIAWTISLLG